MSFFKKADTQGGRVVVRDENSHVVPRAKSPLLKNWRKQLREATELEGGNILLAAAVNIALGNPVKRINPEDGTFTWDIPAGSDQRQMLQFLLEMDKGKAVAQTEVVKAEQEANDHAQLNALSDEALRDAARPFLERMVRKQIEGGADEPDDS